MQTYRISAWDLNTNVLLTDLEGTDVIFADRLNDAGEFSATLSLTDPEVKELTAVVLGLGDNPFKFLVTSSDNTRILYAGISWKPSLSKTSEGLKIVGKALPDYFRMVVMANSYVTAISPVTLIQNALSDAQNRAGYNIGIATRTQVSASPPNFTPSYPQAQLGTVGQILSDVTASITPGTGGVDWYMEHGFNNGVPSHTMVVAAPRAGRSSATSPFTVDLATTQDWTRDTDATASGNHIYVVGMGSGGTQPKAEGWVNSGIGGYGQPPRLEQVLQFSHVADPNQLKSMANGMIQIYGKPVTVMTVQISDEYESMPLGSFQVGDDVRVWVEAKKIPQFPNGLNEWWRVVGYRVELGNSGGAKVILTLNRPPVF